MATPFKMKGSPMERNFGIGSPLHNENNDEYEPVKKSENFNTRIVKLDKEYTDIKDLKGKSKLKAFERRHNVKYTKGTDSKGREVYMDPKGNTPKDNELKYLGA